MGDIVRIRKYYTLQSVRIDSYDTFKKYYAQSIGMVSETDDDVYRPVLQPKTKTLLQYAKKFIKQMEDDLNRDPSQSKYRNDNRTFDNDMIIREALAEHWGMPADHDKESLGLGGK